MKKVSIRNSHSNVVIEGSGLDGNGNMKVFFSFGGDRKWSFQTGGNMPRLHHSLTHGAAISSEDAETFGREIADHIDQCGSKTLREKLCRYGATALELATQKTADGDASDSAAMTTN